ncbi:MFS transporter [Pseudoalteromonas sp. A25]|uniref:MFS transporter n=1 Tax=Pseudoalteromonas sp. A25 TaxID=116092 RepID=UPI0012A128DB|nr:MFS transporter [Pseudoalteromonas sp. A25]BBN82890.1 MFS transporter [Pseudoalteromonas sp. A25]
MTTSNLTTLRWLTYMMFFMFAMTSDAVGVIIPELIEQYNLTMTQASAFHYAPMIWIAISGLCLGFLADKIGHKTTILIGLTLFSMACFAFAASNSFLVFVILLSIIGVAIGLFKTAALALLGSLSPTSHAHTKTMNTVEGFFALGAIVGPALVSYMIIAGVSWIYLYVLAGILCILLALATLKVRFAAKSQPVSSQAPSFKHTLLMFKDLHALGFSAAIALYVATEVAIYVWMPTLLKTYQGEWTLLATYALTIFFILRALGRFMATWLLNLFSWQLVMLVLSTAIFLCYLATYLFGVNAAVVSLPLSGLFMSMIYPTLNSKGISCFAKHQHGSVAGVILFFTALSAAVAPLLMGVVSDHFGHIEYGFALATAFAALLMLAMLYNWWQDPAQIRLADS